MDAQLKMKTAFRLASLAHSLLVLYSVGLAQVIPADRTTDWSTAGFQLQPPEPTITVSILDYGGAPDGLTPNGPALTAAFAAVQGQMGVVHFPPGNYLFNGTIFLPDSVILRGATADSTTFTFTLPGYGYCIAAIGSEGAQQYPLSQGSVRGTSHLWTASTAGLVHGDEIRLYRDDSDLVTSAWALGTAGQIARVGLIEPDGIDITSPLRASYPLTDGPYFRKLNTVRHAGIECLKLVRTDAAPPDEWSNIHFNRASHCWVRGVESEQCNFAHVELFTSTNCEVSGCYFHHAFAYGGSGQGYGVLGYYTAGENMVVDNIFEHLRHAMIVQAGANGNVFAYNRSVDPYWNEGIFPPNAAGEIVLHGDHAYLNLFESNIVQNIVIDDSHGANGPFNTLFRNRAGGWGLLMNSSPATDSTNLVGNEVLGSPGLYVLNGNGRFEYGNEVQGSINPSGTGDLSDSTYYATELPDFLLPVGGWPQVGPNHLPAGSIPAAERYAAGNGLTVCTDPDISTLIVRASGRVIRCHPSPFEDRFVVEGISGCGGHFILRNAMGAVVLERSFGGGSRIEVNGCGHLSAGIYLLEWRGLDQRFSTRIVRQ